MHEVFPVRKVPGTDQDVKRLAIGAFLERSVVERANDDLCFKRTLCKLASWPNIPFLASAMFQTRLTTVYHFF